LLQRRNAFPRIAENEECLFRFVPGQDAEGTALAVEADGVKQELRENRFHKFRVGKQGPLFALQFNFDLKSAFLAKRPIAGKKPFQNGPEIRGRLNDFKTGVLSPGEKQEVLHGNLHPFQCALQFKVDREP